MNKFDGLIVDQLTNRWSFTDSQTNATIGAAVSGAMIGAPSSVKEIRHLDFLHFAILNKNALNATVTASVRDVSAAGAVLAQWAILAAASSTTQVNAAEIHLLGSPGKGIYFAMDTVAPSVTASVTAAGWTDKTSGA